VSWYAPAGKWVAQIRIQGKPKFLGYFDSEVKAAQMYDEAARPLGRELNSTPISDEDDAFVLLRQFTSKPTTGTTTDT